MRQIPSTTDIVVGILQSVGLYALNEQLTAQDPGRLRHIAFRRLSSNAVGEAELRQLHSAGLSVVNGRGIMLPEKRLAGVSWSPLLWVTEKGDGDHRLQVVIAGNGRPFGYRWEPPEGGGAPDHNYWHAQPIMAVRTAHQRDVALGLTDDDICTHVPTFPIDAPDRLSLLDALLVSIYGPGYLERYVPDARLRAIVKSQTLKRCWAKSRISQSRAAVAVGIRKSIPKGMRKKKRIG